MTLTWKVLGLGRLMCGSDTQDVLGHGSLGRLFDGGRSWTVFDW